MHTTSIRVGCSWGSERKKVAACSSHLACGTSVQATAGGATEPPGASAEPPEHAATSHVAAMRSETDRLASERIVGAA